MSDFLEKMIDEGYDPDLIHHHLTGEYGNAVIDKLQELEDRIAKLEGYIGNPVIAVDLGKPEEQSNWVSINGVPVARYNTAISSLGATYTKPVYDYMTDIPAIHREMNG